MAPSRTASPSTRLSSRTVQPETPLDDDGDVTMADIDPSPFHRRNPNRPLYIISVDYGTTYSAVSFVILNPGQSPQDIRYQDIQNIAHYPEDPNGSRESQTEVPSEIWYRNVPKKPRGRPRKNPVMGSGTQTNEIDMSDSDGEYGMLFSGDSSTPQDSPDARIYWGYEVQGELAKPRGAEVLEESWRCIKRAKLMLDEGDHTKHARQKLLKSFSELKERKLIKKNEDVITDFLTALLRHVKTELQKRHGFEVDRCDTEFVICVPPVWSWKSARVMDSAMCTAVEKAGFKATMDLSISSIFTVSEPEAAATFFLAAGNWDDGIRVWPHS